jgi:uncharacterized repeat protein (TIGR02543 family)
MRFALLQPVAAGENLVIGGVNVTQYTRLYALWDRLPIPNGYVQFNANGGLFVEEESDGSPVASSPVLTMNGLVDAAGYSHYSSPSWLDAELLPIKDFLGWAYTPNATEADFRHPLTEVFPGGTTTQVYAVWRDIENHTVTFMPNKGVWPDETTGPMVMGTDRSGYANYMEWWFQVFGEQGEFAGQPQRDDYTFVGWNTAPDGSGEVFLPDSLITKDMYVYAIWRYSAIVLPDVPGQEFYIGHINFAMNDGSGELISGPDPRLLEESEPFTINPQDFPSKTDMEKAVQLPEAKFVGWSARPDAEPGDPDVFTPDSPRSYYFEDFGYSDYDENDILTNYGRLTFYAVWLEAGDIVDYEISLNVEPAGAGIAYVDPLDYQDANRYLPEAEIELVAGANPGYLFSHWRIDGEGSFSSSENSSYRIGFIMPDTDTSVTAVFTKYVPPVMGSVNYRAASCSTCHSGSYRDEHKNLDSAWCNTCHDNNYPKNFPANYINFHGEQGATSVFDNDVASELSCGVNNEACHAFGGEDAGDKWHGYEATELSATHSELLNESLDERGCANEGCHISTSVETYFWFGQMDLASAHNDYWTASKENRTSQNGITVDSLSGDNNPYGCGLCHDGNLQNPSRLKTSVVDTYLNAEAGAHSCNSCHSGNSGAYTSAIGHQGRDVPSSHGIVSNTMAGFERVARMGALIQNLSPNLKLGIVETSTAPLSAGILSPEDETAAVESANAGLSAELGQLPVFSNVFSNQRLGIALDK